MIPHEETMPDKQITATRPGALTFVELSIKRNF